MSACCRSITTCAALLLCLLVAGIAESAEPRITVVLPRGGERGTSVAVTLHGQRLHDATDVIMLQPGITVDTLEVHDQARATVVFHIAEDCTPGLHALRVQTATGLSNLITFSVGTLPEIAEAEPNNTREQPQEVSLGCVINGVATNEDVDYYAFHATAGQRISAEIEGLRISSPVFDPAILLFDPSGHEIASCDDAALLRQDAWVSVIAPVDGVYVVSVRESAFRGNGNCRYRLHLGSYIRPAATIPSGGRPGETVDVTLLGDALGAATGDAVVPITLPADAAAQRIAGWADRGTVGMILESDAGSAPSPNWFRVSDLANVIEAEPNNGQDAATPITIPAAVHGIIDDVGDRDIFVFTAKKGETWNVEVFARRLRSPLDAVINIRHKGGANIAGNDDDRGSPDSRVRFTAPEDGEYILIVRDHLGSGGPMHAYRVEIDAVRPHAVIQAARQVQHIAVPRGQRAAIMLSAAREDFGGDLLLQTASLPDHVSMAAPVMDASVGSVPVVFEASADAPAGTTLTSITAHLASDPASQIGMYRQDVELALGRNNTVFWAHSVDQLPVTVVDQVPYSIEVATPQAPLVRNGSTLLTVKATRAEGFEQAIRLDVPFAPPGVGAARGVVIAPDQTEATITLNANSNAPIREWQIVVTASANAPGGGQYEISTPLIALRIAEPFATFQPQGTTAEQGQRTTMAINVTRRLDQPGPIMVELHGLPHNVSAEPVELAGDAETVTFEIQTQSDSPPGRHRNLFCIARFSESGEPVVHRLPAGELRIDKPLPQETAAAQPAAAPPPPAAAETTQRPLTRLEKLRFEDEQRRARLREAGKNDDEPEKDE